MPYWQLNMRKWESYGRYEQVNRRFRPFHAVTGIKKLYIDPSGNLTDTHGSGLVSLGHYG